jgi:hypothetical protein
MLGKCFGALPLSYTPALKKGVFKGSTIKLRHKGQVLVQFSLEEKKEAVRMYTHTHTHIHMTSCRRAAVCKPRRETSRKPTLLTFGSEILPPELRGEELCSLSGL